MICLDTLKLKVPGRALHSFKSEGAQCVITKTPGKKDRVKLTHRSIGPGWDAATKDLDSGDVILVVSAKILGSDYGKLINGSSIDAFIHIINSSGLIEVKSQEFLRLTSVLRADVTKDIKPSDVKSALSALSLLAHPRFHWHRYPKEGSVEFLEKGGKGRRLLIYDKGREIKLPRNDRFLTANKGLISPSDFDGMLRFELKLATVTAIRKAGLCERQCRLDQLLQIQSNPILDLLDELLRAGISAPMLQEQLNLESLSLSEYIKIVGRKAFVAQDLQGRSDMIPTVVKALCPKSTASRLIREIRKSICWKMHPDNSTINELIQLLSNS